jgi:uncharacterized protein (DUF2235 family)
MVRLAVFLDGTWGVPAVRTNVPILHDLTARTPDQQTLYVDGIGTRLDEVVTGGLFGYGANRKIRQGYAWLAERYRDGDQIFLFGFSRGAYCARSLAGMISRCGLMRPDGELTVEEVERRYRQRDPAATPLYAETKNHRWLRNSRVVPIEFIGVWDTVGELGVPFGRFPFSRSMQFHDTGPSPVYRHLRHALAIDETARPFKPTLWTDDGSGFGSEKDQDVEQRWFIGSHLNVGGGFPAVNPLATIPLAWMQREAERCGLAFTSAAEVPEGASNGRIWESYTYVDLPIDPVGLVRYHRPVHERATPPMVETVDPSVRARWDADPGYRPPGLVDVWSH